MIKLKYISINQDIEATHYFNYHFLSNYSVPKDVCITLSTNNSIECQKLRIMLEPKYGIPICSVFTQDNIIEIKMSYNRNTFNIDKDFFETSQEILENKTLALMYSNHKNPFLSLLSEISLKIN